MRWLPVLNVSFDVDTEASGESVMGPSLSFELPIFNIGDSEIAELAAKYRQAVKNALSIAIAIRSEVRTAREQMTRARQAANYYLKKYLPERQKISLLAKQYYNAMLKGVFQLLAAKNEELIAQKEYIEVLRDYWISIAALERAVASEIIQNGGHSNE